MRTTIKATVIKENDNYTSLRYTKPDGLWSYFFVEPMGLKRGEIVTITIDVDDKDDICGLTLDALKKEIRLGASELFGSEQERLIQHALYGAEWRWYNKTKPYDAMYNAITCRYPVPSGGRSDKEDGDANAFQFGATAAYEIIKSYEEIR